MVKKTIRVIFTMITNALIRDLTTEFPRAVRQDRLVVTIRQFLKCGAVGLLRLDGDFLSPVAVSGLAQETLGRRFEINKHPRLAAILSQREIVHFEPGNRLPDPYDGLLESKVGEPLPVHDCMGIALYPDGQCWGVLTLDSVEGGVFDSRVKSSLVELAHCCEAVIRMSRLEDEIRALHLAFRHPNETEQIVARDDDEIIGRSPVLLKLLHELDIVAASDLPVLLMGETGVGKELLARRIHRKSDRRNAPMIHVNCAALPESLVESELFGHVKGAFSGAVNDRAGRFEAANGGVIFLDEVGELPLSVQAKLLRTLQNGEIQRLGSDKPLKVDVRVIAATNRELATQVKNGEFRADLYHRLSVYPVPIPPLRERGNDILLLAGYFLELNRSRLGFRSLRLSSQAEQALLAYPWPGNIRELEHVISRAAIRAVSHGAIRTEIVTLDPSHFDLDIALSVSEVRTENIPVEWAADKTRVLPMKLAVDNYQRQLIKQSVDICKGNWAEVARRLELDPSNLHKLAKRLGLK